MTLAELRARLRIRLDDTALPYKWLDSDLDLYLNEALTETCIRTQALVDRETAELCRITLVSGQVWYNLDPRIIQVHRATLAGESTPMRKTDAHELDQHALGWESDSGKPVAWFEDGLPGRIGFYKTPDAAHGGLVVSLSVARTQLDLLEIDTDEPELHEAFHLDLLDWAERQAFLRHDSDTYSTEKAAAAEARYVVRFGYRMTANVWTQRRRGRRTRVQGYYI